MHLRLEKEDCDDIAFVLACFNCWAISLDELKEWVYFVVGEQDEVPAYFWDVLDVKERQEVNSLRLLGYVPHWDHTLSDARAVDAIAYQRNPGFQSDFVGKELAQKCWQENPHIEQRFRTMFPFIER